MGDYVNASRYENCCRWADRILERPAVQRGMQVCDGQAMEAKPWQSSNL